MLIRPTSTMNGYERDGTGEMSHALTESSLTSVSITATVITLARSIPLQPFRMSRKEG
jgi:hypothetical protein